MWSQFLILDRRVALVLDSLETTHPIYAKINDPTEIAQQFDMITYLKGSSMIRMLAGYLNLQSNIKHNALLINRFLILYYWTY
jgi:aminopeptidase N